MKAVFLDFATMGAGLDLRELESLVDELVVYDESPGDTVAERIAGDLADVRLPVPSGKEPAYWSPSPEDIVPMQEADALLTNGADYAPWAEKITLPSDIIVNTTAAVRDRYITTASSMVM